MRLTEECKVREHYRDMNYRPSNFHTSIQCYNKLGQLEDIEEEMGFERSGSSLLAFLQSPYIKSIMRLYVSARKHLEEECKVPDVYENSSDLYDAIHIPADKELVEKYKEYYGFDTTAEESQATYSHIVDLEKDYGK